MTIELEQKFYDTFGIKPKKLFSARQGINPNAVIYPEITAEKLLKMICICSSYVQNFNYGDNYVHDFLELSATNIQDLKEEVLKKCNVTIDN